jgi:acyl transferase domain-containing protein
VIGHSVGEVAMAYFGGMLTLEDAVTIIHHRSRLQQTTSGRGRMLAASITKERAEALLRGHEHLVSIGAVNSDTSLTLSGDGATLETVRLFRYKTVGLNRY